MAEYRPLFEECGSKTYVSPHDAKIIPSALQNQSNGLAADWYKDASFYQVWVKSFCDTNGDGVGDLQGVINKLDYIQNEVGCDAIWLSPVFKCGVMGVAPSFNMHGYDTVDYYKTNCLFGNEQKLDELISSVHDRGMKIVFDYVPNHTSAFNQWFVDSENHCNGKDSWYLWAPKKYNWAPMGFKHTWSESDVRVMKKEKCQYYYGAFGGYMPDLNYRNAEVREELANVVRYWFNRGFDGMRVDAVRYLYENPGKLNKRDVQQTHDWFAKLQKEVVSQYAALGHPKFMVGEAWIQGHRDRYYQYFGTKEQPEFNMLFDFDFTGLVQQAVFNKSSEVFKAIARDSDRNDLPEQARFAYMLNNHDNLASRPATLYADKKALRFATAVNLLAPATPFVYYGNEIEQKDATECGWGDMRLRYPFDWEKADVERKESDSMLSYYHTLLTVRKNHPALRRGKATYYEGSDGEFGFILTWSGNVSDKLRCSFNVNTFAVHVYQIASDGKEEQVL